MRSKNCPRKISLSAFCLQILRIQNPSFSQVRQESASAEAKRAETAELRILYEEIRGEFAPVSLNLKLEKCRDQPQVSIEPGQGCISVKCKCAMKATELTWNSKPLAKKREKVSFEHIKLDRTVF